MQQMLMEVAHVVAKRSTCSRLHVGAVLAWDGRILSTGYNGAPRGEEHCTEHLDGEPCAVSMHAEANAIAQAASFGVRVAGSSMYLTHAPCLYCAGLMLNARIRDVWFQKEYRSQQGIDRLKAAGVEIHQTWSNPE